MRPMIAGCLVKRCGRRHMLDASGGSFLAKMKGLVAQGLGEAHELDGFGAVAELVVSAIGTG